MHFEINGRTFVEHYSGYGTLNVVPYSAILMGVCKRCDHRAEIARERLEGKRDAWLDDLAKRLRCSGCGEKDVSLLIGYYAAKLEDIPEKYRYLYEGQGKKTG